MFSPPVSRDAPAALRPIGVFDSGVGGLSVLRALRAELPQEDFVYLADSAHAPYGEKGSAHVAERSLAVCGRLLHECGIKAFVLACNTATAAAVEALRARWPQLPIVGIEPALKPAAALTQTGHVGVLATRGTLQSARFARLLAAQPAQVRFTLQPCDGLAHAIEQAAFAADANDLADHPAVAALAARNVAALGPLAGPGAPPGAIDTLVLGCTHYPLIERAWQAAAGPAVALIEPGPPVARHTRRLLDAAGLLHGGPGPGRVRLLATGDAAALHRMAQRLGLAPAPRDLPGGRA